MDKHIDSCDHEFIDGPKINGVTKECSRCGRIEFLVSREFINEFHLIIVEVDGSHTELR